MTLKRAREQQSASGIDFWVSPNGVVRDHSPWLVPGHSVGDVVIDPAALVLPDGTSTQIHAAPARGPVDRFKEFRMVPVGTDKFERVEERYGKGAPVICRDIFDTMNAQAMRRKRAQPIFTPMQADAGRRYRDLVERVATAGMKMSSAFQDRVGGADKVDFIDAYMADLQRLAWFHRAIGDGTAKDIRSKRTARAGSVIVGDVDLIQIGKRIITVRRLVDDVCLREYSLSKILRSHGWSWCEANARPLRAALCSALDRMRDL